ncbi:MAG: AmmeMemoRadiSam system protein B [Gemmatimonadota bacterium]
MRPPAVAGRFYPADAQELEAMVRGFLADVPAVRLAVPGVMVPHAGLVYSGACMAQVFGRLAWPETVVILAPNHTGRGIPGKASLWDAGAFRTPLGDVPVAERFAAALAERCPLVARDRAAHRFEHAIEVVLPFVQVLAPGAALVPLVLAWDDWGRCADLARALAELVQQWNPVLLAASSDMTHHESAWSAAWKDRLALTCLERLDGEGLLAACHREHITMCGRAPAATVAHAARLLGAIGATVVDYRNSGLVTGDEESVVGYAGVVMA